MKTHLPEFLPMPSTRGGDPIFGISRSQYYKLEKVGAIAIVRLRKRGQKLGRCLINCDSVRRYLAKLDAQQNGTKIPTDENAIPKKAVMSTTVRAAIDEQTNVASMKESKVVA